MNTNLAKKLPTLAEKNKARKSGLKKIAQAPSEFDEFFERNPIDENMDKVLKFQSQYAGRIKQLTKAHKKGLVNLIEVVTEIASLYREQLYILKKAIPNLTEEGWKADPAKLGEYIAPIRSMQATLDKEFRQNIMDLVSE